MKQSGIQGGLWGKKTESEKRRRGRIGDQEGGFPGFGSIRPPFYSSGLGGCSPIVTHIRRTRVS